MPNCWSETFGFTLLEPYGWYAVNGLGSLQIDGWNATNATPTAC